MKINKIIPIMLLLTIILMGCNKYEKSGEGLSKDEMNFTAGSSPNTKTVYSPTDPWQINWREKDPSVPGDLGDQITIFCDQAGNKQQATYDVTPVATTPHKGTITLAMSESSDGTKMHRSGLRWREGKHNVYAVYPSLGQSDGNITKISEGLFTFNFPQTQYCSIEGVNKDANGNYMLIPDMNLAYMVAKNEGLDPLSNVELLFKPIATTLEITLRGKSDYDIVDNIDLTEIVVKSLKLKINDTKRCTKYSGSNNYQVQFNANGNNFALTQYPSGSVSTADFTIKIEGNNGEDSLVLKKDESVTFTVFLPPIENLQNVDASFYVKASGNNSMQILKADKMEFAIPGSKRRITMPSATKYPFSDWMTRVLKDNKCKVVTLNGKEVVDLSDSYTYNRVMTLSGLMIEDARLNEITGELTSEHFKGIEYLPKLLGLYTNDESYNNSSITSMDLTKVQKTITTLRIRGCTKLTEIKGLKDFNLQFAYINNNSALKSLDLSGSSNLEILHCNNNSIYGKFDLAVQTKLKYLECYNNKIDKLIVNRCDSLEYINCSFNSLTDLDVSSNKSLKTLYCYNNSITTLSFSDNNTDKLQVVNCSSNNLGNNLNVSKLKNLTGLTCSFNSLPNIDVTNNTHLRVLNCDNNQITGLNVDNNKELITLNCDHNPNLGTLNINNNEGLTELRCAECNLSILDLTKNTKLIKLYCEHNNLVELDVSMCPDLSDFMCLLNKISELDITNNSKLAMYQPTYPYKGAIFGPQLLNQETLTHKEYNAPLKVNNLVINPLVKLKLKMTKTQNDNYGYSWGLGRFKLTYTTTTSGSSSVHLCGGWCVLVDIDEQLYVERVVVN